MAAALSQSTYTDHTPDYLPAYTIAATVPRITFTSDQLLRPEPA